MIATDDAMEILAAERNSRWNINFFFNRVRKDTGDRPIWINDRNDILKITDPEALDWYQVWNDRIKGDWFLMRLANTSESLYKMLVKWVFVAEKPINS